MLFRISALYFLDSNCAIFVTLAWKNKQKQNKTEKPKRIFIFIKCDQKKKNKRKLPFRYVLKIYKKIEREREREKRSNISAKNLPEASKLLYSSRSITNLYTSVLYLLSENLQQLYSFLPVRWPSYDLHNIHILSRLHIHIHRETINSSDRSIAHIHIQHIYIYRHVSEHTYVTHTQTHTRTLTQSCIPQIYDIYIHNPNPDTTHTKKGFKLSTDLYIQPTYEHISLYIHA